MTKNEFIRWLAGSSPGDKTVYHRGFLFTDRIYSVTRPVPSSVIENIKEVGIFAMRCAEAGYVHLVQERHGDFDYGYLAVRGSPPSRAISFSELVK